MSKYSIECKSKKLDLSDYRGWNAWVGIDLSKKNDLTACTLLLVKDDQYRVFNKCYLPETIKDKKDLFWNAMINHGYVELTEGYSVDYEPMIQWLMYIREEFDLNIQQVMYDNWNAAYIVKRLNEEDFDIMEHKQSHAAFNGAVANAEILILDPDKDLLFDENKLVPYCFDNVVLTQDRNGNSKPDKTNYEKKVDVAISFLQAVGAYYYVFENDNIDGGEIEVFVL
jgi:phage terminase large subunit-like protein